MFGLQKATQLTPADDQATTLHWLAEQYAYPPRPSSPPCLPRPYVRANMVASIDGAVTVDGRSGGLGGPGDKAVFRVLRGLADVVLVGASTAVTEGYGQPSADDEFAADRAARDQMPAPALALLSRSLSVPDDFAPVAHPDTVILTCRSAPTDRRSALAGVGATLIDCGDDTVDPQAVLDVCAERGWVHVLTEGGPSLLGALAQADALDELCVTTAPVLVGGDAGRIVGHADPVAARQMRPVSIITDDDGFVFTRWARTPADEA
ncbi:pyrimidine reductase family protein [Gordonia sp. HNM0687]|uniref:Pyrimidine reductase family protein n=1 Tax=Gordonia mangrovi TaxID=2665643 RepID=A0A6L7GQZ4_9ACTN|nr:dihydrofolate reductase family protein [Gordonia mangrovi]MXP22320.1 pyrimidine reductase family protein [Gordonia mangrovi]UVF77785.1 dihydrofolate reductase family protein [Gordonia mangrovi]